MELVLVLALLAASQAPARPAAAQPARPPLPTPTPRVLLPRPPAPPGLSWEDSDALERLIARAERRLRSGRPAADETVVVTERQLNSYLNLSLGPKIPQGVSGLELRLGKDRLGARAMLDLDRVKARLPQGAASGLLALLSGVVPVEINGRVSSAQGNGRVEIEGATVAGVGLPASLIAQLVSLSTRSPAQPKGFDILAPFPLPWKARQLRLEPGRALVDF